MNIIRIGDDFFKFVQFVGADGTREVLMKGIKRQTILDDYGKDFLKSMPKYDGFVNVPDNDGTLQLPNNLFNMYTTLSHQIRRGDWKWTRTLLQHIFGDQYELGLDYIQLIYDKPLQILPVLCLVSKENQTGKTTFLNWLRMVFKENMIVIGNQELSGQFNFIYGHKLIIAIEESRIERSSAQEKIKAMATQKKVLLNEKFQRSHSVDYFGKLILVSNHEDNFISANKEDIRYWIRKVPKIPKQQNNFDIEDNLLEELPAFLYFLRGRTISTVKESRAWFATELIETQALNNVREYSHTPLYQDLRESLNEYFATHTSNELKATAKQLIDILLNKKHEYNTKYLTKVLKDEFEMQQHYGRFTETHFAWNNQPGYYYIFKREEFIKDDEETIIQEEIPF
jgi:hypothetical protein